MTVSYDGRKSFSEFFDDLMDNTYFEINVRMIGILPKFSGFHVDNPLTHLRDVHNVCSALRPRGVDEDDFILRMFLYSLTGYAKSWLFSLSVNSMPRWKQMRQLFLKEYSIRQHPQETTYEYLERFRDLWGTCPDYSLPDHVVAINFLDGMNLHERDIMDNMAGGSIMDCYSEDVWDMIYKRAAYTKPHAFSESYVDLQENRPRRSVNDMVDQLAQAVQEEKESTDKALAEILKQVSQISRAIFEKKDNTEKLPSQTIPNHISDMNASGLRNKGDHNEEERKKASSFDVEQTMAIVGEESVCDVEVEKEGTPISSLPMPIIPSLPSSMDEFALTQLSPTHQNSLISCSKVSYGTSDKINVSNILLPFYVHRSSRPKQITNEEILDEESFKFYPKKQQSHSMFGWKPGWDLWRSACGTHNKRKKGVCNKFDGAHPWAPNL